jgi:tRNA pseudouridine65 synthase
VNWPPESPTSCAGLACSRANRRPETVRETLPLLYRDEHLVAVHKPSGLLVHRAMIDRHETRFALQIVRDQIGQRVTPVHRLDKGTSGVLLFALNESAARQLGQSFDQGRVDKRYVAVVRGWTAESGVIDHPLRRIDDAYGTAATPSGVGRKILQVDGVPLAERDHGKPQERLMAQPAITHFQRLACAEIAERVEADQRFPTTRYSLLALQPTTGRQHQLRRHLKHIAHPIIGDATYGKGVHNRFIAQRVGVSRLLLACRSMTFPHPVGGQPLCVLAPLSADMHHALQQLGWPDSAWQTVDAEAE